MSAIEKNVILGIPTTGNIQGLLITLTGVLQGVVLPRRILIRAEGHFPAFNNYYLEQIADVARQRGVEFVFAVTPSLGLRGAVDWLMQEAECKYFWMLADDVLPCPIALGEMVASIGALEARSEKWGFVTGNKQDVNNRRNWPDYSQAPIEAYNYCPTYGVYLSNKQMVANRLLDNSHAVFNRHEILKLYPGVGETAFEYGFQCGGDDTLFGFILQHRGLSGWFCPGSQAFHLEKEGQNFTEPTARAEAIYRQAQMLGLDLSKETIISLFPYCRRYGQLK